MSCNCFDSDPALFEIATHAPGPQGVLPLTGEMLRERPSGDLFGWSQNAAMGWNPAALGGKEFLILSTHGGLRAAGWLARWRWATTRDIGRWRCWWRPRRGN